MKKKEKILRMIQFPSTALLVITSLFSLRLVTLSLVCAAKENSLGIVVYFIYSLSAIFFTLSIYILSRYIIITKNKVIQSLNSNKITYRFTQDKSFRTIIYASCSLIFNALYAVFYAVIAIKSSSIWFSSLACYYICLVSIRSAVVFNSNVFENKKEKLTELKKLKIYRFCGTLLVITIIALSVAIAQMVLAAESFKYLGLMIYVGALYSFIKIVVSVINYFKAKKLKDITIETIRNINLADAAVSILALQTAMFQAFSPLKNVALENTLTGAVVCILILFLGVSMIVKGTKKINKIKKELLR